VEPYLELGRAYLDRREYDQALETFYRAVQVAPEDARPYFQAGMALKECKDYHKAEKMLRKAAEFAPHDISIHRQLGAVVALNIVHSNREASVEA
jgi:Flp pilus assembly protein TadD